MSHDEAVATPGCDCPGPGTISRRAVVGGAAIAFAGGGLLADAVLTPTFAAGGSGRVLVVVSQRGGADGLSLVVPHAERAYYAARPGIAIPRSRLLAADHHFGLHPSLAPLLPLWRSGRMAAVHAVGMPSPNRSHFEAMLELEQADPRGSLRSGWLNRLVDGLHSSAGPLEGVQSGSTLLPQELRGSAPTIAVPDPFALQTPLAGAADGRAVRAALRRLHSGSDDAVARAGRQALAVVDRAAPVRKAYQPSRLSAAGYPSSPLGRALQAGAAFIRSGVGVRTLTVDSGDWDHHVGLSGRLEASTNDLARSLQAFFADLGDAASRVTVVTVSEFGRRLQQNGGGGLDHGYGGLMLVLGGGVKGGYYARWPGLAASRLVDGDLAVTTDYRHVLAEVVDRRFPEVDRSRIFPGAGRLRPLGFMR